MDTLNKKVLSFQRDGSKYEVDWLTDIDWRDSVVYHVFDVTYGKPGTYVAEVNFPKPIPRAKEHKTRLKELAIEALKESRNNELL